MSSICRNNNNSDNNCNFSVRDSKDDDEKSPPQLAVTSGSRSPSLSVDDFEILGRVGGGGFGEVHMVRHIHKNKIFAMKVLKKNLVTKKNYKRHHLLAERNVMAWADSPWVVQLSYSFQDDVNLYLVMELLQGGDLFERWKVCGECMPENEVRFYIAELAAAVNSVHEMNFVHRDLKPDNILIDNEGHIKLTDFGLSSHVTATADANELPDALRLSLARRRSFDCLNCAKRIICQHAKLFSAVGTVEYTAPEVLAGSSEGYSPSKCDWWSVGIIMFQLLTGDVPFASESQVLDHRYHLSLVRRGISREARSLLKNLICDEKERFEFEQLKSHKFFDGVNWDTLRSSKAPWVPIISSEFDVTHFRDQFQTSSHVCLMQEEKEDDVEDICCTDHVDGFDFRRSMDGNAKHRG